MSTVRYKRSVEPVSTDGRDINLDVAELSGEAASQEASGAAGEHIKSIAQVWQRVPSIRSADPTYYDRPMLKEPVWTWMVPLYYYTGGLTGAALALAAAAQLSRSRRIKKLIRRCRWIGFLGAAVCGMLLVFDLGRPSRFFNMLRVFRPTSPMNMGAWLLSAVTASSSATLLFGARDGGRGAAGDAFGYVSGALGLAFATYTGVLISSTAVPVWQESRRVLPILFGASAMASLGYAFELFVENPEERRVTKAFGTAGQLAEIAASIAMEKQVSVVPRVARPLKRGLSGFMWRAASALMATSLLLSFAPRRTRKRGIAAGLLGTCGSLLMRFAVERAGVASARDARASFHQQRAGHGAIEVTKAAPAIP